MRAEKVSDRARATAAPRFRRREIDRSARLPSSPRPAHVGPPKTRVRADTGPPFVRSCCVGFSSCAVGNGGGPAPLNAVLGGYSSATPGSTRPVRSLGSFSVKRRAAVALFARERSAKSGSLHARPTASLTPLRAPLPALPPPAPQRRRRRSCRRPPFPRPPNPPRLGSPRFLARRCREIAPRDGGVKASTAQPP